MFHSCGSSSPGCFVPALVGLMGKWELWDIFWIPACAGMTINRRHHLAFLRSGAGLSTARGEVSCFIRLTCYQPAK